MERRDRLEIQELLKGREGGAKRRKRRHWGNICVNWWWDRAKWDSKGDGRNEERTENPFFHFFFTGGKLQLTYTGLPVDGCRGGVESKVVFYFDCGNHVGQPSLSRYVVRIEDYNIYLSGKGLPAAGFTQKLTVNERKHYIQKKAIDP